MAARKKALKLNKVEANHAPSCIYLDFIVCNATM